MPGFMFWTVFIAGGLLLAQPLAPLMSGQG
jgi:hypothetical protein